MKKTGSTNHVRFTVSDILRAEAFYDPLLRFMGRSSPRRARSAWPGRCPPPQATDNG
jgi:hypothetical protein